MSIAARTLPSLAVLAFAVAAASCSPDGANAGSKPKTEAAAVASPYVAIAAGKVDVEGGLVDIAARQPGIVRDVLVREGDEVVKDQILARLDDKEARLARDKSAAALREAIAEVARFETAQAAAQRDVVRQEKLGADNFVSPQRIENARDALHSAESQLEVQRASVASARAALAQADYIVEQHVVRAPDQGRIVRRYANPGSGASTLQVTPMFQLQPRAPRIVRAEVEERSLGQVRPGMRAEIVPEADQSKSYPGSVVRIADVFGARKLQSDDQSKQTDERVVEVVIDAGQAKVLVGQRVLVKFVRDGAPAPAPAKASKG